MSKVSKLAPKMQTVITSIFLSLITLFLLAAFFSPNLLPFDKNQTELVIPSSAPTIDENTVTEHGEPVVAGKPARISVPAANIDLSIIDGVYNEDSHEWSLSTHAAHYAVVTPLSNNIGGNTFMYGHNRDSVFARLLDIEPGDSAFVETENGHKFHYVLKSVKDVDPTDVSLFLYEGEPILTVQTCSGTWYENRRLFTFDLLDVEAAS